jgi:hypothetical protein
MVMFRTLLIVLLLLVATVSSGCGCDTTSDFLTVSVMSTNSRNFGSTTPKWNDVYTVQAGFRFRATASWGVDDPAPAEDLLELYRDTAGELEPIALQTVACGPDDATETTDNECISFTGASRSNSCPFEARVWVPEEELVPTETYLLVLYPERGNGRELSWDGERVDFDGEQVLTSTVEVAAE